MSSNVLGPGAVRRGEGRRRHRRGEQGAMGAGGGVERLESRALMSVSAVASNQVVVLQTSLGEMAIELLADAPISRANFLSYVTSGAYDKTIVHRTTFADSDGIGVVQAGGYKASDLSHIATGAPIVNEFNPAHPNATGTVAMARTSAQNSATSEFFINTVDNTSLDNAAGGNAYAVFGNVIRGLGVAKAINDLGHATTGSFTEAPVTSANQYVIIGSAVARDEVTVTIGGSEAEKSVMFRDADGTVSTISVTGAGTATIKFSGSGLKTARKGTQVIVSGTGVEAQQIETTGTTAASALNITGAGGRQRGVVVGTINVAGGIGSIKGTSAVVTGDITTAAGVGKISLLAMDEGTMTIGSGSGFATVTNIDAQSLGNSSVDSSIAIGRLTVKDWSVRDGSFRTFTAPSVGVMTITGNLEASTSIAGTVGQATIGAVNNTRLIANVLGRATLGTVQSALVGGLSPVGQGMGIASLTVRGKVQASSIVTIGDMGTVKVSGGINNTDVIAGISQLPSPGKFPTSFGAAASLASLTVSGRGVSFIDSRVAGTTIGKLSLGRVATKISTGVDSASELGVKADKVGSLTATTDQGQRLALANLDTQAAFDAIVAAKKLRLGKFSVVLI